MGDRPLINKIMINLMHGIIRSTDAIRNQTKVKGYYYIKILVDCGIVTSANKRDDQGKL